MYAAERERFYSDAILAKDRRFRRWHPIEKFIQKDMVTVRVSEDRRAHDVASEALRRVARCHSPEVDAPQPNSGKCSKNIRTSITMSAIIGRGRV